MSNSKELGFVAMERLKHFASRHGTERGDDPVFDELYDYAGHLYECLREAVIEMCHAYCEDDVYRGCPKKDGECFVQKWRKTIAKAAGEEVEK